MKKGIIKSGNKAIGLTFLIVFSFVLTNCEDKQVTGNELSGLWRCEETGSLGRRIYNVDIARANIDTTVSKLYNFHNAGYEQYIFVVRDGSKLIIEDQFLAYSDISVSGSGTVAGDLNTIELQYLINEAYAVTEITATLTRIQ